MKLNLVALPAFTDNYIWMLHDRVQALVVDPGEAAPVRQALGELNLRLSTILVTHHHHDHVGGLAELLPLLDGPLWGPSHEPMPVPVRPATQAFEWAGLRIEPIAVPGHTLGHVAYFLAAEATLATPAVLASSRQSTPTTGPLRPVLFCGDTLFSAGCGRLFEGSPAQMQASLDALNVLPAHTLVCCTHEYTLGNLRFAQAVEPLNSAIQTHHQACERLREQGLPTLPSELAQERQINPFLRCEAPAVVAAALAQGAGSAERLSVFTTLRLWKNQFR